MKTHISVLVVLIFSFLFSPSQAEETRLVVRVKAKDAKYVGTSMGGALVIVRESESGEILARGLTSGSTGNTKALMKEPHKRGVHLSDEAAAKFETTLDIAEPKLIRIEAQAPMAQKQAMVKASTEVWLIPGKDILGDGVTLEVTGFALDILEPQTHGVVKLQQGKAAIPVRANMVML